MFSSATAPTLSIHSPRRGLYNVKVSMCYGAWKNGRNGVIWESHQIEQVVQGRLRKPGYPGSICTDTRALHKGEWFLALVGPNFDGNHFLHQALAAGCAGVIGRSMPRDWPVGFVEVSDALGALHKLAASVRSRYTGHVVAITGSCGKTTTRAMTALALESLGHIHQTLGNMNNHVGLPLTLLKLPSHSSACVLEMGMNHAGEILQLCDIARPSVRVILNVGPVHLQNFKSVEDIAAAKGELLVNAGKGDTCILNSDDPLVMALPVPEEASVRLFGSSGASAMRLLEPQAVEGGRSIKFTLQDGDSKVETLLGIPGVHHAINACAAACVATTLGVQLSTVSASISKFTPVDMRTSFEVTNSEIQLINDTYNANPLSMTAALQLLAGLRCTGKKVVALGDMLELGSIAKDAHRRIIKLCRELHVDVIGTVGSAFAEAVDDDGLTCAKCQVLKCATSLALANKLVSTLQPGDAVLVKGSRGMKMEYVVEAIRKKFDEEPGT